MNYNVYGYFVLSGRKNRLDTASAVWRVDWNRKKVISRSHAGRESEKQYDAWYREYLKGGYHNIDSDTANKICKSWGHNFKKNKKK